MVPCVYYTFSEYTIEHINIAFCSIIVLLMSCYEVENVYKIKVVKT